MGGERGMSENRNITRGKRTLAVVRCGDNSLHESWTAGSRDFDFAISYFGNDLDKKYPGSKYVDQYKGGKWDGLFHFFQIFPQALIDYDYFWFPDDDISATSDDINKLIDIGYRNNLELFQPTLDVNSFYSHLITLQHPSFKIRYSNFVEIMAPMVSRDLLVKVLPTMDGTRSGFGLDFIWPRAAADLSGNPFCCALIDEVSVHHTRAVGGSLHKLIKTTSGARSSNQELDDTMVDYSGSMGATLNGQSVPNFYISRGVLRSGKSISGLRLGTQIFKDMVSQHKNKVQPVQKKRSVLYAAIAPWEQRIVASVFTNLKRVQALIASRTH
jgi:hypothetical protein